VKRLALFTAAIASASMLAGPALLAKPPTHWDGLVQVKSKRLELVYLQPGADFRGYTKVLVEPTEIAFAKNWQRDYNRESRVLSARVSDGDVQHAIREGVKAAHDIFTAAWIAGGYAVVTEPGPDVLRVKTGIVNIAVTAPDQQSAARSHSFSGEAGFATLFVEARDSLTGALIGRAVDRGIAGDHSGAWRTASSNRADFREMVENWARISVRGVTEFKSLPLTPP
jgi:hypothetical protein